MREIEQRLRTAGRALWIFFKWLLMALAVGLVVGGVGTLFSLTLAYVTGLRVENPWLIYLLPVAGLSIVLLYHLCRAPEPKGTDLVIDAVRGAGEVPGRMAPLIFLSTALTHLCGGSAGREGAALQLGGSLGSLAGKLLHMRDGAGRHVLILCGMSAAFSALFGTPLAATVFALELVSVGVMYYMALVPCAVSALVAAELARICGAHGEHFALTAVPTLGPVSGLQLLGLAILCAALSVFFCFFLHQGGRLFKKLLPNPWLRVLAGAVLVIALHFPFGQRYLGSGMDSITLAVEQGQAMPWDFALKLLFTAVTLGSGFKGGEIVPCLFVGATFGCWMGGLLGMDPGFAAALGMISLFCGVTNCPLTALLLAFELFSFQGPLFFLLAVAVSYMLSGYSSLYASQRVVYSKLRAELRKDAEEKGQ